MSALLVGDSPLVLVEELRLAGITLSLRGGDRLKLEGPAEMLSDELLERVREQKAGIISLMTAPTLPRMSEVINVKLEAAFVDVLAGEQMRRAGRDLVERTESARHPMRPAVTETPHDARARLLPTHPDTPPILSPAEHWSSARKRVVEPLYTLLDEVVRVWRLTRAESYRREYQRLVGWWLADPAIASAEWVTAQREAYAAIPDPLAGPRRLPGSFDVRPWPAKYQAALGWLATLTEDDFPPEPFAYLPGRIVHDTVRWLGRLHEVLRAGPGHPRAQTGAFHADVRAIVALLRPAAAKGAN